LTEFFLAKLQFDGKKLFVQRIFFSIAVADILHNNIRTFLAKAFFYTPATSREGNLDSFLLLFLIFCLVYKKQIDPNDIGKVRKNFNVKN